MNRRRALAGIAAMVAAGALPKNARTVTLPAVARDTTRSGRTLRRIATEEHFTIPEIADAMRDVVRRGGSNLDLKLMSLFYGDPASSPPPPTPQTGTINRDAFARTVLPQLLDIDSGRLALMDAHGVDVHLLLLVTPGVQMFEPDK